MSRPYRATETIDQEGAGPVRAGWEVERVTLADSPDTPILYVRVDGEFDLTRAYTDRDELYRIMTAIHAGLWPSLAKGVDTGATYEQLAEVLETWHKVLADTSEPNMAARVREHSRAVRELVECVSNLHMEAGPDRSAEPVSYHRREVGLCPDEGDHWLADCPDRECPNWVQHMRESAG